MYVLQSKKVNVGAHIKAKVKPQVSGKQTHICIYKAIPLMCAKLYRGSSYRMFTAAV